MTKLTFKERYAEGMAKAFRKPELKALKKTPETAEWVTMKVSNTVEVKRYSDRGWEMVGPVTSLFNAGSSYFMRKLRTEVEADR